MRFGMEYSPYIYPKKLPVKKPFKLCDDGSLNCERSERIVDSKAIPKLISTSKFRSTIFSYFSCNIPSMTLTCFDTVVC